MQRRKLQEEYRNGIDQIFNNIKKDLSDDEQEPKPSHAVRTLYIKNLNEKVPLKDLKECLYVLAQRFGQVLDIKAKRNVVMRGQAFVVFKKKECAKAAKEGLNGFTIFNKAMEVNWAKRDSDFILPKDKRSYKIGKSKLVTNVRILVTLELFCNISTSYYNLLYYDTVLACWTGKIVIEF